MKTIIFDFDGTIVDTFQMTVEIGRNITGNKSLLSREDLNKLRIKSTFEIVQELNIPKHMWPFLMFRGRRQMAKRLDEIKIFKGIDEVISNLHENGFKLLVISSNSSNNITKCLRKYGIKKDFRKIYGGVGLLSKARALRKVLASNRLDLHDVIYVGDEVRDIEAAKDVGIDVVAVTWGFNDKNLLEAETPNFVVRSRPELLSVLITWGKS